jgi:hypothetical protein
MPSVAVRGIAAVIAVQAVILTALSGRYGFHRDELYFRAAGRRLDWGYVDQPPLTPVLARLFSFGDSPVSLRITATLIGAAIVLVVALTARELGAGHAAQVLAASATALSIFVLAVSHMLSTASVDTLLWTVAGFFVIRLLRTRDGRWWIAIGAAVGVALTNKWLIPLLILALGVSLVAVGPRQVLRTWWLVAGVAVALVISAPVVIWQAAHDFPLLTVARGISNTDGAENRVLFIPLQLMYLSPVLVPVLVAGFLALWRDHHFRAVAVSYPVLCAVTLAMGGKSYYTIPTLLLLLAAGVEPAWRWTLRHRMLAAGAALVGAAMSIVGTLPVLPVSALPPLLAVNKEQGEQVGWREFTASVARAYRHADPGAVIFTRNYGQAGAVERYGPELGLPQPYSGHMSYADWGPPPDSETAQVVVVGRPPPVFTNCHAVVTHRAVIPNEEDGTEISVCDPVSWSQVWPQLRRFYS